LIFKKKHHHKRLMARYNVLPTCGSLSIEDALSDFRKNIALPSRIMLFAGMALCVLLPILRFSLWMFPICLGGGIAASIVYTMWWPSKWWIGVYWGVADIHQFQRSAELKKMLPIQSPYKPVGIMSIRQREQLAQLQARFGEDEAFIDDASVQQT